MKKILSFILILSMLLLLVACGTTNKGNETTTPETTTTVAPDTSTPEPETTTTEPDVTTTEPPVTTTEPPVTTTEPPAPVYPAAIKTAEDFANMNADGEYYLANDITITATWNGGKEVSATYADNVAFVGILDGKGFTVNTTVPLFANLQGTVSNLTVAGEIAERKIGDTLLHAGGVAMWTNGELHVENVTNKANILGGTTCGGILGYGATGTVATFINCVNDGNITCASQVGGIAGYIQDNEVTITDCVNNGNIKTANYGAGIIGRFGRDAADVRNGSLVTITGCTNNGTVTAAKSQVGGMLGYLVGGAVIKDCVNNGEIINEAGKAAGIFGAPKGSAEAVSVIIENCTNNGVIRAVTYGGGIAAHVGAANEAPVGAYSISGCINTGDVYVTAASDAAIYAAGVAAYVWGGGDPAEGQAYNGVTNSINTGKVIVDSTAVTSKTVYVAGIIGYVNAAPFQIRNNLQAGEITVTGNTTALTLIGYNKNIGCEGVSFLNNYSVANGDIVTALVGETPAVSETAATVVTAEQLASGEVAYKLNEGVGEPIFYQAIGTDAVPTMEAGDKNTVYKWEDGSYSNDKAPKAVTTAEEFAAMEADGNYYLTADITINGTWNGGKEVSATYADNTAFIGIFDGNGFTVNTTTPMFANFQGTIKNVVIAGEIPEIKIGDTVLHNGAVAMWTKGTAYFENIHNKANILGGKSTGALVGYGATGSYLTAVNCVNDGNFTVSDQVGGMFGYVQDNQVTITNCTNNGNMTTANYGGGIVGRFGRDKAAFGNGSLVTITGCTNNGKVVSAKGQSGGILGYLVGGAVITDCINNGEIVNETAIAGGIFGSNGNQAGADSLIITNCINYGKVTGVTLVGGIAGRQGRATQADTGVYRVENCINYGDVLAANAEGATGNIQVAGISGYAYGGSKTPNGIINCINFGTVTADNKGTGTVQIAAFVGYVNSNSYEIQNNINLGQIVCATDAAAISLIGYNKASAPTGMYNNYSIANGEIVIAQNGDPAATMETVGTVITAEQLASGEVVYLVNKEAGKEIFFQKIGTDAAPTLVKTDDNSVYLANAGGYTNVAADGILDLTPTVPETPAEEATPAA